MQRFLLILTITILGARSEHEKINCNDIESKSVTMRLKNYLFCDYDFTIRPGGIDETIVVEVRMYPQYIEFNEQDNTLDLSMWLSLSWRDVYLLWEPEKWENIRSTNVHDYQIWIPEFSIFNTGDLDNEGRGIHGTTCELDFNGTVTCVMPAKYTSHCPTDYSDWPYDIHSCTLQFGSWMYFHNEIGFKFENEIPMFGFTPNPRWNVQISKTKPEYWHYLSNLDETVLINVKLQRHGARLTIVYILPAIVMMALTIIVLSLDYKSLERILIACINFICHILCIYDLHWYFPTTGSQTTPRIIMFYETSISLAAVTLVLTCLLRKLVETTAPPPTWIISGTNLIINSSIGGFLRLDVADQKRDSGILEDGENNGQIVAPRDRTWKNVANILEWISLFAVSFVYIVMLAIVIPPGPPKEDTSDIL